MTAPPATFGTSNQRIQRYGATSTALALLSNRQLGRVLDAQPLLGNGIGGTSALLDIDGMPVFAKRIPLTDLERRAENVMSTANLFELSPYCHSGSRVGRRGSMARACRAHDVDELGSQRPERELPVDVPLACAHGVERDAATAW